MPIRSVDYSKAHAQLHPDRNERLRQLLPLTPHYLYYLLGHILLSPFIAIRSIERAKRRGYKGIIWPRLLGGSKPPAKATFTVFAAGGMGEMRPAIQMAEEFASARGEMVAILTKHRSAMNVNTGRIFKGVLPFNNPVSVLLFLARWRPKNILIVEFSENVHLAFLSRLFGVRTVIFNVPIMEEETLRVLRKKEAWRWRSIGVYSTQAEAHRERLLRIGVRPEQIVVTGPMALSIGRGESVGLDPEAVTAKWRDALKLEPEDGPVVVAGSTHLIEEPIVVDAFLELRKRFPKAVLVMAARDLRRTDLAVTLEDRGLDYVDRKSGFDRLPESRIVLLNSYGELKEAYSIGDIAFVGGTFTTNGGHTPVEALAWYLPVTLGPGFDQQRTIVELLVENEIAIVCKDAEDLAETWIRLACEEGWRRRINESARRVTEEQSGRVLELYDGLGLA